MLLETAKHLYNNAQREQFWHDRHFFVMSQYDGKRKLLLRCPKDGIKSVLFHSHNFW